MSLAMLMGSLNVTPLGMLSRSDTHTPEHTPTRHTLSADVITPSFLGVCVLQTCVWHPGEDTHHQPTRKQERLPGTLIYMIIICAEVHTCVVLRSPKGRVPCTRCLLYANCRIHSVTAASLLKAKLVPRPLKVVFIHHPHLNRPPGSVCPHEVNTCVSRLCMDLNVFDFVCVCVCSFD